MISQKDLRIYQKYYGDQDGLLRMAHLTNETVSDWSLVESLIQDQILILNGNATLEYTAHFTAKLQASCEDEETIAELRRVALQFANHELRFYDLYWHDSTVTNITIDRSDPGHNDIIKLDIHWMDEGKGYLLFEDVYKLQLDMNFGIVANECILTASVASDRNDPKLNVYTIELNSTGGMIKIIAKTLKVFFERGNRIFTVNE
jgi:hypothetical protein